jgi:diguanylate cyclase (GGDEF)-like protein
MSRDAVRRSELSDRLSEATMLPAVAAGIGLVVALAGGVGALVLAPSDGGAVRLFSVVSIAGSAGGLIALGGLVLLVRRRVQAEVSRPVAVLLAAVTRAALDDFRGDVTQAGVSELREIASGFNHLLRLQRRQQHLNQTAMDAVASRQQAATQAAMLHKQAEEASLRDGLTGLYNRRKLDMDLATECERSLASGIPLSYVMIDIDHFKAFNDTHGHQGGDELLRRLGALLAHEARATDSCYRYGGEEFALILRGTSPDGACVMTDRLRQHVAETFIAFGTPVTASFGVSAVPDHGTCPEQLIAAADGALYVAKDKGRNCVVLGSPRQPAPNTAV